MMAKVNHIDRKNSIMARGVYGVARETRKRGQLYIMLLIPMTFIVIFNYIPMGGLVMAFQDYSIRRGIFGSEWAGLTYFKDFFTSPIFMQILWNTFSLSIYSIIAGFPIPILLALALNECKNNAFRKTVQMLTYAPFFISTVVIVGIIMRFLSLQTGLVNNIISVLGGERINFLGLQGSFQPIYVWSGVWQNTGYAAVIYLAALSGIDPTLFEAAIIDGADRLQRVIHIDLPGIMPTIVILLLLSVGSMLNVGFEKVFLLQNQLNIDQSEIISTYVYKQGLVNFNYSYATAIGLFNSFINMILLVLANGISKRVTETSLW